jgi:CBS domain-containing protein
LVVPRRDRRHLMVSQCWPLRRNSPLRERVPASGARSAKAEQARRAAVGLVRATNSGPATGRNGGGMKVRELMTPEVEVIAPDDTLHTAAQMMADLDVGALPVGENDRLVGMISDRDITVRAVAKGCDPDKTTVRNAMSEHIRFCFEDDDTNEVANKMGQWQVRRLPVLNRDKRLVGIVSLGDLAIGGAAEDGKEALTEISEA